MSDLSKSTPGPWKVQPYSGLRKKMIDSENFNEISNERGVICYIYKTNWGHGWDSGNAELIASAPSLKQENEKLTQENEEIDAKYNEANLLWKQASDEIGRINELLSEVMKLAGHHVGQSIQQKVETHLAQYKEEELTPSHPQLVQDVWDRDMQSIVADNQRLREALQHIADYADDGADSESLIYLAISIASEALKTQTDKPICKNRCKSPSECNDNCTD